MIKTWNGLTRFKLKAQNKFTIATFNGIGLR